MFIQKNRRGAVETFKPPTPPFDQQRHSLNSTILNREDIGIFFDWAFEQLSVVFILNDVHPIFSAMTAAYPNALHGCTDAFGACHQDRRAPQSTPAMMA